MNLSGRLIDAFLALEDTRRFAVAAERCHMSPSAFSQMIGRLEQVVGARLFDRDTRNVSLTPEGQAFSVGAHRIADEMSAALTEMKERSMLARGRLSIAAPPSLAAAWMPALLAAYQREHPGVSLRMHDVVSDRCLAMLSSGEVDIGLNAQRGNDLEFESTLLFNDPFFLVCRRDDPLAARKRIPPGRSARTQLRADSALRQCLAADAAADDRHRCARHRSRGGSAGHARRSDRRRFRRQHRAEAGLQLCDRPGLVAVRIADASAKRPIYRIRRRNRTLSAAAETMWRLIGTARRAAP